MAYGYGTTGTATIKPPVPSVAISVGRKLTRASASPSSRMLLYGSATIAAGKAV